jgi:hypothetical protein
LLFLLLLLSYSENEIVDLVVGKRKRDSASFVDPSERSTDIERNTPVSAQIAAEDSSCGETSSDAGSTTTPDSVALYSKSASTVSSTDHIQKKGKKSSKKASTFSISSSSQPTITAAGPKLLSNDIRLNMMNIWITGFNSCDAELMAKNLAKYCVPDCLCLYKFVGTSNPHGPDNIELMGREAILSFWETTFKTCPDFVMKAFEIKFRLSSTTGYCYSSCNCIFHCTKLQSWSFDSDYHFIAYNDASSANARDSPSTDSTSSSILPPLPVVSFFPTSANEATSDEPSINSSNVLCLHVPKSNPTDTSGDKLSESLLAISITKEAFGSELPVPLVSPTLINKAASNQAPTRITVGPSFAEPQKVIFIGTLTIYMNPDKKVYKMEVIHSLKQ